MPYIIARRSEIQNGSIQVTDLFPDQSQANLVNDPAPQGPFYVRVPNMGNSGFFRPVLAEIADESIVFAREARGLVSYIIKNVDAVNGAGTRTVTVTQAETIANAILARAQGGLALAEADINALLVATLGEGAAIDAGDSTASVDAILQILAGEQYVIEAGYVVQDAEGDHVVVIADTSLGATMRRLVERDTSWQVSFNEGTLAGLVAARPNGFAGNTATTPLVAVYNTDGTVYNG